MNRTIETTQQFLGWLAHRAEEISHDDVQVGREREVAQLVNETVEWLSYQPGPQRQVALSAVQQWLETGEFEGFRAPQEWQIAEVLKSVLAAVDELRRTADPRLETPHRAEEVGAHGREEHQ